MRHLSSFCILSVFVLCSCHSKLINRSINDSQFTDDFMFLSEGIIGEKYTYSFKEGRYSLRVLSNENGERLDNRFSSEVENGAFTQKRNKLNLFPEEKMCFNLGNPGTTNLIIPYEVNGICCDHIYVSKDSLSAVQIKNLQFNPRLMTLKLHENELHLVDNKSGKPKYHLVKN